MSTVEELRLPVYLPVVMVMFDQEKVSWVVPFPEILVHIFSVTGGHSPSLLA